MEITGCIGWSSRVNKIILDSSSVTVGKDATISDDTTSGKKITILKGTYVPYEYSIEMDFNWADIIEDIGKTEYQVFLDWYEYEHKYGTVPFSFPKIIYSPRTGITIVDSKTPSENEYYKIIGPLECSKRGNDMRVKMTWQTVYTGIIQIPQFSPQMNGITKATKSYVEVSFSTVSMTEPLLEDFRVTVNGSNVQINGYIFDSFKGRLYFTTPLSSQKYVISVIYNGNTFSWEGTV